MSWKKWLMVLGVIALSSQMVMAAREGGIPFRIWNRLRIEYDDNYDELNEGARASFKAIEEVELAVDLNLQQTFIGFNVRPSVVWWENRPGDSTDFQMYADFILNHSFSRRVSLSFRDTFRRAEAPELVENGFTYRENGDYYYNSAEASLSMLLAPKFYTDLSGGYSMIKYDTDQIADENNYNKYRAGARMRYQVVPESEVSGAIGYENVDYKDSPASRSSSSLLGSVGLEQIFSPNLLGSVVLGVQSRENEDSFSSDETAPYADVGLSILPSPATRFTLGASYMLTETDVYPYSEQQRLRGYASMSYDLTAKLQLSLSGSYTVGDYKADDLPKDAKVSDLPVKEYTELKKAYPNVPDNAPLSQQYIDAVSDKSETSILVGTALSYQLNRINWVEVGWRFTTMDSDLRDDFDRNIFHAGWKLKL